MKINGSPRTHSSTGRRNTEGNSNSHNGTHSSNSFALNPRAATFHQGKNSPHQLPNSSRMDSNIRNQFPEGKESFPTQKEVNNMYRKGGKDPMNPGQPFERPPRNQYDGRTAINSPTGQGPVAPFDIHSHPTVGPSRIAPDAKIIDNSHKMKPANQEKATNFQALLEKGYSEKEAAGMVGDSKFTHFNGTGSSITQTETRLGGKDRFSTVHRGSINDPIVQMQIGGHS